MRILLVEDETKTAACLRKGLAERGFEIEDAVDGEEGLHRAVSGDFELVILDVMLPRLDGWEVLARLRRAGRQVPVLFLTARDGVADRVKGLDLGADDYLVKPFAFTELLARIRSILRRGQGRGEEILRLGGLELQPEKRLASREGHRLELTPKEFALLLLLARRAGEVLSRAFIAHEVWDLTLDGSSNVVDVHVRRLRAKVDDPFERKLIRTVRGAGYLLEAGD